MPQTSQARTRRGRGHHRADHSTPATTPLDQRRYFDFRAGMSPAELAARENVTLATIEKSILRMRTFAARNSQESAELATRQLYLERLPDANQVFAEALVATRKESYVEMQRVLNPVTREEEMQEVMVSKEVPDHDTRLKATTALKNLLAGVQPKQPMVAVDARSQTNFNGVLAAPANAGALSFESLVRQIHKEQGLLTVGDTPAELRSEPLPDVDMELADDLADAPEEDDDLLEPVDAEAADVGEDSADDLALEE